MPALLCALIFSVQTETAYRFARSLTADTRAPVWLDKSTEFFMPRVRSSLSIFASMHEPIPRRRCDGTTYMLEHQADLTAFTLRTQPTIEWPSMATYCRKGTGSVKHSCGIGRVRVAFPKRSAISCDFTWTICTGDFNRGTRFNSCTNSGSVLSNRYPSRLYSMRTGSSGSPTSRMAQIKNRPRVFCRASESTFVGSTPYATHSSFR